MITDKKSLCGENWLIAGDKNDILSNEEKQGGRISRDSSFHEFRDSVQENNWLILAFVVNLGLG